MRLSLDDFGTGYSSPDHPRRFSFDDLKIDRSFTSALASDQTTLDIVQAMVGLSHDMDLEVIAEGVETADLLNQLSQIGADQAQRCHCSRAHPCPAAPTTCTPPARPPPRRRTDTRRARPLVGR